MKHIITGVLVCLVALSFAFMVHEDSGKARKEKGFATEIIRVSLDESGTGLILDDGKSKGPNITTKVAKKSVVKWKLDPNSGITSLDSIVSKNGVDIFISAPSKDNGKELKATVGDFESGTEEEYGIYFTVNGVSYMHDPKIQVH